LADFTTVWSLCYAGLKPAAFAALVPNSANKPLEELIDEIMGDHEMLVCILFPKPILIIFNELMIIEKDLL